MRNIFIMVLPITAKVFQSKVVSDFFASIFYLEIIRRVEFLILLVINELWASVKKTLIYKYNYFRKMNLKHLRILCELLVLKSS